MFPYRGKYNESEYDIQNNNLLYKIDQQCQTTFEHLETFWKPQTLHCLYKLHNSYFVNCINVYTYSKHHTNTFLRIPFTNTFTNTILRTPFYEHLCKHLYEHLYDRAARGAAGARHRNIKVYIEMKGVHIKYKY